MRKEKLKYWVVKQFKNSGNFGAAKKTGTDILLIIIGLLLAKFLQEIGKSFEPEMWLGEALSFYVVLETPNSLNSILYLATNIRNLKLCCFGFPSCFFRKFTFINFSAFLKKILIFHSRVLWGWGSGWTLCVTLIPKKSAKLGFWSINFFNAGNRSLQP